MVDVLDCVLVFDLLFYFYRMHIMHTTIVTTTLYVLTPTYYYGL